MADETRTGDRDMRRGQCGGSAFPTTGYGNGMTLLDYFAGQALVGYLAAHADPEVRLPKNSETARAAWAIANAMLAAREDAHGGKI